jgi:hypothetical protein
MILDMIMQSVPFDSFSGWLAEGPFENNIFTTFWKDPPPRLSYGGAE